MNLVQLMCVAITIVVSFHVESLEALDLDVPSEPKATVVSLDGQEPPPPPKRELVFQDRFSFAKDDQHDDKRGCCPCGTHHCCGSMCHG